MKRLFTSSRTLWSCFFALAMMLVSQSAMAEYVNLTALSGSKTFSNGEGSDKLVDGKIGTKWGQSFDPASEDPTRAQAWVVVKADEAVTPTNYFLVTGSDTGSFPTRNWKKWKIYGGNFESDDLAVRDNVNYVGWTLIDERNGDPLPEENSAPVDFTFNKGVQTAFQYFWIEVLESVAGTDIWLQMDEWGLGSFADFQVWLEVQAADPTKPVTYTGLAGSPAGFNNEGWGNLIDGKTDNKWCTGFTNREEGQTANGGYVVFKASRPIAPTYYSLITGNDTGPSGNRNWKQWQIYGMNASSDADVTRDAQEWVLLDKKENIGHDQLPAANFALAYFTLSEENTTAYKYFKIEIDQVYSDGLMQMTEFGLGDDATLALERENVINSITYNPDLFAEKALLDQLADVIEEINACEGAVELGNLNKQATELQNNIEESVKQYAELTTARNMAANQIADDDVADAVLEYVTAWASEENAIAPNEDYPVGNYAYIAANRQLTGEEAAAEAKRFTTILLNNTKTIPDPIGNVGYMFVSGTTDNWGDGAVQQLIDGDPVKTKWGTGTSGDRYIIFKANTPIKPTYYGLVTGGDTGTYTDRNWKNWKIWAANFDSDEEATKNSDKWVLIDVKENVGTDVLKTTSLFESYINLSIGCSEPYEYYKIEVYHQGGMQMNEFTFYNMGDLAEYRESFLIEFDDFNNELDDMKAYIGDINAYKQKYQELATCANAPDVMKLKNELADLQTNLEASVELYERYDSIYNVLQGYSMESESLSAWKDGYINENVAPGSMYIRGTYAYIMNNLYLNNDSIQQEIDYLQWIINAVDESNPCNYILLGGHTEGQWGDGFYGHLIDGIDKDIFEDGEKVQSGTKWGGSVDKNGNSYIIFRTLDKTCPFFYTLTTGNDSHVYTGRNWKTWYIYGANFEGDGDATKDAEGWVLIDSKENIGQDRLHPEKEQPSYFGFSTETTEEYLYYKVVVTEAYDGNAMQMNELHFGTEDEFDEIKASYVEAAQEFDYDVVAEQALIDQYETIIDEIDYCVNMEALFRTNYDLEDLRARITASVAAYEKYQTIIEEAKTFLQENNLDDSEAKATLDTYLNGDETVEPSETYPNGSAAYVVGLHELADSVLLRDEIEFMESLKTAAVAAGYGVGAEITPLIVNNTFAKAGETLKDEENKNLGRVAEGWDGYIFRTATDSVGTVYAAEFCNENKTFNVSQTLSDLKNGFYKVTLNAGFRANGDLLSYNYGAMAYANDVTTYVPVIIEDAVPDSASAWMGATADRMIYNADSTESFGIGIWGCEGSAKAFRNGRYAITMVAKVVDGQLTIGVKNEGTKGNEWTAAGNFRAFYLGETEEDAAAALEEAAAYNDARIVTLTETYESPTDAEDYSAAPGFGEAQKETLIAYSGNASYEAQKAIGETMQEIYETKKAYIEVLDATNLVYEKWVERVAADETGDCEIEIYDTRDNLELGAYGDAAAAIEAKEALYAHWPDYLELKASNSTDVAQDGFTLDLTAVGTFPYISLTNTYDALTEDEVILAFEYMAEQDVENGRFMYETPNFHTDVYEEIPTLPAAEDWTKVYINVSSGVDAYKFGTATNHAIRWYINYNATAEDELLLSVRNFQYITEAQMKAEGGKALNGGVAGDLNGDGAVDISDAVAVLDVMASGTDNPIADFNGDGVVDISDFVCVLDFMAQQ